MMSPENRFTLFGITLWLDQSTARPSRAVFLCLCRRFGL